MSMLMMQCITLLMLVGCPAVVLCQFYDTVHGSREQLHLPHVLSPNKYYLEYRRLQNTDQEPQTEVYLNHPALPVSEKKHKAGLEKGMDCKTMMDQSSTMSSGMKDMMCDMYKQWGGNMKHANKWHPTPSQQRWWQSLAMPDYPSDGGRPRRQTFVRDRAVRKEYRALSDDERVRFHNAVNTLKNSYMDGERKYDMFVRYHQASESPGAHFGPAFYGWHRELLFRFERALQEIDPSVSLPYWDSNLDYHLGDDLAQVSVLWTKDFLGNGKGDLIEGPFAHWSMPFPLNGRLTVHRNLTVPPPGPEGFDLTGSLMSDRAIRSILQARSFRNLTWYVDMEFEGHHGTLHNWVGGSMADLAGSPSDPVFFLHHAFIDCLWEQFRQQSTVDPRYDYPNDSIALGVGVIQPDDTLLRRPQDSNHYSLNTMRPFAPMRNIDGHKNDYTDRFYTCDASPSCSSHSPHCGSDYLFCDLRVYKCAPKLQLGAPCLRFDFSKPCLEGVCCSGICQNNCESTNMRNSFEVNDDTFKLNVPTKQPITSKPQILQNRQNTNVVPVGSNSVVTKLTDSDSKPTTMFGGLFAGVVPRAHPELVIDNLNLHSNSDYRAQSQNYRAQSQDYRAQSRDSLDRIFQRQINLGQRVQNQRVPEQSTNSDSSTPPYYNFQQKQEDTPFSKNILNAASFYYPQERVAPWEKYDVYGNNERVKGNIPLQFIFNRPRNSGRDIFIDENPFYF